MEFLKRFALEVLMNGKSLVVWLMNEVGLSGYPGFMDALNAFMAAPSKETAITMAFQLLWAVASGHRLFKLILGSLG